MGDHKMNLLQYKQRQLMLLSKDKDDISYKYLKWFMSKAEYITKINQSMSKELGLKAEVKGCYRNSFNNIWKSNLRYYEGYIFSKSCPIPLEHAYLMDENNMIVDPTMGISEDNKLKQFAKQDIIYEPNKIDKLIDNEYIGIHIKTDVVAKMTLSRQNYDNNLTEIFLKSQK